MNDFLRDRQGKPVYVVGVQAHNSSTGTDMLDRAVAAAEQYHANTLEAPVYWYQIEPEEDQYCMDSLRALVDRARQANLRLIVLWFGASKNGHPNYVPEYIKLAPERYWIASGPDGAPVASLSPHCPATLERDTLAFSRVMRFLKEYDGETGTVLAAQVENEMGYANTDRDYGKAADRDFEALPDARLLAVNLPDADAVGGPTWRGHFGRFANEAFSAWHTARYIDRVAAAGKREYDLCCYTNVMIGENGVEESGFSYNGGSPVSRMLDVWKIAAPHLDLIAPDIYNEPKAEYLRIITAYDRADNALFVPESPWGGEANAVNSILAAGRGAVGVSVFGCETALAGDGALLPEARPVAVSLRILAAMAPLLIRYRGTGRVHAFTQDEYALHQYLRLPHYHVDARFTRANPTMPGLGSFINLRADENRWMLAERGRGLLVQTGEDEFFLCGSGISVYFIRRPEPDDPRGYAHLISRQSSQLNFLTVDEGHFEGDTWVTDRYRNGDETNFGLFSHNAQAVRIRLNPNVYADPAEE